MVWCSSVIIIIDVCSVVKEQQKNIGKGMMLLQYMWCVQLEGKEMALSLLAGVANCGCTIIKHHKGVGR